jgi:predicted CopG family antitoxin
MELKETEIVASYSGKIATGRFENAAPFFSIKETWSDVDDEFVQSRQKSLHGMCYERFAECEKREIADRIKEQNRHFRFYQINNEQFPSVTSIIGWDADFFIPQEQLIQYGARGTIIHKQVEIFLKTGEWKSPEDIPEVYPELVILKKGELSLSLDGYDFCAFYEKHPFETMKTETQVFNLEYRYAGRMDIKGVFDGKISIMDVKTGTIDEEKCFKQLSAYAKAEGNEDVEQLVIIPLNSTTKQGFSKPKTECNIEKYWELFKRDRKLFKQRFGL